MRLQRVLGVLARRRVAPLVGLLVALALLEAVSSASVLATTGSPGLTIHSLAVPTNFSASDNATECLDYVGRSCDGYQVTVTNGGAQPAAGPITISDALPAGLTVREVQLFWSGDPEGEFDRSAGRCTTKAEPTEVVRCTLPEQFFLEAGRPFGPDDTLEMDVYVTVGEGAVSAPNTAAVTEGGSPVASTTEGDVISATPPPFGPSAFLSNIAGPDGAPDARAGEHPYEFTAGIDLNSMVRATPESFIEATSVHDVKDVVIDLPLGVLGSALTTPTCTFGQLQSHPQSCPLSTMIGRISTRPRNATRVDTAIYNMVPEHGVMAEFGYADPLGHTHALYASIVPTRAGYTLRITARELPQVALTDLTVTLYGDPAARNGSGNTPAAMLTNPSACSGEPLLATVHMDSWQAPGAFDANGTPAGEPEVNGPNWVSMSSATQESPPVTGCDELRFQPDGFTVKPDTTAADSPAGLTFDLKIPQSETPETLATPPLRDATVTLPAGLTVDPSAASGLQACTEQQIGWLGPVSESNAGYTNFTQAAPTCPEASKVASVEVTSPLIEGPLKGSVYLATQDQNPYGSLLAVYVVIDDERTGTIVKVPGKLVANETTGQITAVFNDSPQIPFSELKVHFFGGEHGDLATPEGCGAYTTTSELQPWSAPESGPDATPSDAFQVNSGCVSGFLPAFSAGTINVQAGSFSPFTLSFSRNDDEEALDGLAVSLPAGLLGSVAGVGECSDAQLAAAAVRAGAAEQAAPSCPGSSLIGTVQAAVGPGALPYSVFGRAYLTGPYKGAPFGVAVIVPAVTGPFDLGTVVVREALYINPTTAQVTVLSDPFPTIRDGIPLRIRRVKVVFDRPQFTLNPTSCDPMALDGTIASVQGAAANVSARFQVASCAALKFTPRLTALTRANGEFAGHGASLHMVIVSPAGQANIRSLKVDLPQRLPARLETIQHACPERTFNVSPASCPKASVVGQALVQTPILATQMAGPAILVSHGAAFPNLVLVLQSQGVRIDLTGALYVDERNVTSATFRSIPDVPIRRLDLILPEGSRSIFAASSSLCKTKLHMSTAITAQDNARVKHTVTVAVSGCKKPKKKRRPARR